MNSYLFLDIDGAICTMRSLMRTIARYFNESFDEDWYLNPERIDERKKEENRLLQIKIKHNQKYRNGEVDYPAPSWSMTNWPMCKFAIANLNEIVDITGCDVILSSSWRYGDPKGKGTNRILRENGFKYNIKGRTPTDLQTSHRGVEIQHWLDNNATTPYNYVIIDDDWKDIYGHHPDNFVNTDFDLGITDDKRDECLKILH